MNWQEVIGDLVAAGMTQEDIAKDANCSQAFVSDLKNGHRKDCRYEVGAALVALHEKVLRKQQAA
jgi:transcriptional regulator with XRE-family HTH domain